MIELRPLRQFVAVAEELHFGRAAQRLHMTQPPLTQAVQALERTLQVQLLQRTRRSVALTPAGQALLEQARRLLREAEALPEAVRAAAAGLSGRLRLAFVSSIAYGPLPGWLRSFREHHPDVELQLREATMDVQLEALAAGDIDAGFVLHAPAAVPAALHALSVLSESLVLALPADHPGAGPEPLRFEDVSAEPLLIFPRAVAPSLFDAVLARYHVAGCAPRIVQEAIQLQTIVSLVSAGMGVAWVPASMTQLQRPGVVYRQIARDAPMAHTSLLWQEDGPVVQRFVRHVQAQLNVQRQSAALEGGVR
ncbi:LysR family transcriptional regulator [Azohydromonas caseinilytica]|uniref:LysR family transcriptional regulator n=1 Tax=Azohydromonas caseinilytica TaxID=2728836 RepID=A0A848FGR3_9BURK|nr:LysR family transcriptional regulator [Azohydromonas caseinilytica]NML17489.1 LysR family transcriptional regulator [Azohydromonas caseinilytica]